MTLRMELLAREWALGKGLARMVVMLTSSVSLASFQAPLPQPGHPGVRRYFLMWSAVNENSVEPATHIPMGTQRGLIPDGKSQDTHG